MTPDDAAPADTNTPDSRHALWIAIVVFASLSIYEAVVSTGFLEADSCAHYLYARFAFAYPVYFVNVWGRPICTGLYALPAVLGGRLAVRFTSLAIAIGCALVAYRIAKRQEFKFAALAGVFTLAQPLVFLHSFSELTELPFALLLGLTFWMYQRKSWIACAVFLGLLPLSRPEGFGFLLLGVLAFLFHRRFVLFFIALLPLLLWNITGWILYGSTGPWWKWLIDNWPYAGKSLYDSGSALHFVMLLPAVISPLLFPIACVGAWRLIRSQREYKSTIDRLIVIVPLFVLVAHSILFATGKMASSGELRYMLIVAPFWGLLAADGFEWVAARFEFQNPILIAAALAIVPTFAEKVYPVLPLVYYDDGIAAQRAVAWYRATGIAQNYPRIATPQQLIFYFLDACPIDSKRFLDWRRENLSAAPAGVIAFWDPMYAKYNADADRAFSLDQMREAGWIDVTDRVPNFGDGWHVLLSAKDVNGNSAEMN